MTDAPIKKGERLEATRDVECSGQVHWRAPFTSGFHGVIPIGTIVEVTGSPPSNAEAVYCTPIEYERVEKLVVPDEDRNAAKYDGYTVVVNLAEIGTVWRREQ